MVALCAAACSNSSSGSPTTPRTPDSTTPPGGPPINPGSHIVTGVVINALDDAGAGPASFTVNGTLVGQSEAGGIFSVGFPVSGMNRTMVSATGFVTRETGIGAPASNLRLSLIPATFDLTSFNQMFRHQSVNGLAGGLTRWTSAPGLVLERRVLQFTDVNAPTYQAVDETIADADTDAILRDMRDGYDILTDGGLGPLASVTTQMADAGSTVTPRQNRRIVVTRQKGLTTATGFWGYARWSTTADGEVTSGVIILDFDFDTSTNPSFSRFHRSLRMHELGHTLGCQHVTGTTSVMNSNARTEPNTFDRQSAKLAAVRPTGNRAPDIDPPSHLATAAARTAQPVTWHGAH